jgi:hypothetical protein
MNDSELSDFLLVATLFCWAAIWGGGCALLAKEFRGRPFAGFIYGFLFGPIALLIILLMGDERRRCPACDEVVRSKATICRYCGANLSGPVAPVAPPQPQMHYRPGPAPKTANRNRLTP